MRLVHSLSPERCDNHDVAKRIWPLADKNSNRLGIARVSQPMDVLKSASFISNSDNGA